MIAVEQSARSMPGRMPGWMVVVAMLLALAKLVLVSHDEIISFGSDDWGFAASAARWYWGNAYGPYAYTRGPTYALFVAAAGATGLPQRVVIELVWIAMSVVVMRGLRVCGVRPVLALGAYAIVLLDPLTLTLFNRLLADGLYTACFVAAVVAVSAALCARERRGLWGWSAVASVGAAVAATARPEAVVVWMVLAGAAVAAGLVWWAGRRGAGAERGLSLRSRTVGAVVVPVIAAMALTHVYSYANLRRIGVYGMNDVLTPGFRALYRSLQSIQPERGRLLVSVPRDVREKAYGLSPTFAKLREHLDGASPVPDGRIDCELQTGVKGEYGAWMYWALRAAAWRVAVEENAGKGFASGAEMEEFFAKAAREIDDGMRERGMGKRWVPVDFVPPEWRELGREVPRAVWRNCLRMGFRDVVKTAPETLPKEGERAFDGAALRRTALVKLSRGESVAEAGWLSDGWVRRAERVQRGVGRVQNTLAPAAGVMMVGGLIAGVIGVRRLDARGRALLLCLLVCAGAIGVRLAFASMMDATGVLFVRVVDANGGMSGAPEIGGPPMQLRYMFAVSALLGVVMVVGVEVILAVLGSAAEPKRRVR